MRKIILLILLIFCQSFLFAQEADKTVTLVVSGQGHTQDEAKQNALRNAIEQAFGTFISSNTEILNDELVRDEIVSVANGNIQKFEVLSEVQIPNGGYVTSLKATVSVTKLTSFVESKGVNVEFKGSLFAFNVKQQMLNEENEVRAVKNMCKVISEISNASFDFKLTVKDPKSINNNNQEWLVLYEVDAIPNENFNSLREYFSSNLQGISMTKKEKENYESLGKNVFAFRLKISQKKEVVIYLRRGESYKSIVDQIYYFKHSIENFVISDGNSKHKFYDYVEIYLEKYRRSKPDYRTSYDYSWINTNPTDLKYSLKTIEKTITVIDNFYPFGKDYIRHIEDYKYLVYESLFSNGLSVSKRVVEFKPYAEKGYQKATILPQIDLMNVNKNDLLVKFYFAEIKSLDEINKIKEFKVESNLNY